jgi:hypothetical protein
MKFSLKQQPFSLLMLFVIACSPVIKEEGIQLYTNSEKMEKEVSNFIATGMPIQKAKQVLESNKFDCKDRKNDSFVIEKSDVNGFPLGDTVVAGDYLWCSVSRSYFISSTSWNIFVLYKKDKVTIIHSSIHSQNL